MGSGALLRHRHIGEPVIVAQPQPRFTPDPNMDLRAGGEVTHLTECRDSEIMDFCESLLVDPEASKLQLLDSIKMVSCYGL